MWQWNTQQDTSMLLKIIWLYQSPTSWISTWSFLDRNNWKFPSLFWMFPALGQISWYEDKKNSFLFRLCQSDFCCLQLIWPSLGNIHVIQILNSNKLTFLGMFCLQLFLASNSLHNLKPMLQHKEFWRNSLKSDFL